MTMGHSFTDRLGAGWLRPTLSIALPVLLFVLGLDLGHRLAVGPSLESCLQLPQNCIGQRFVVGGELVSGADASELLLETVLRSRVALSSWPTDEPLPSPGQSLSVSGRLSGTGALELERVQVHTLEWVDQALGVLVVMLWLCVLLRVTVARLQSAGRQTYG